MIAESDREAVAGLLDRGFPARGHAFWVAAFDALAARAVPEGCPRFGYVLTADDAVVGAILLIFSQISVDGVASVRCNLSSWYVDPTFRLYGSALIAKAVRRPDVTYINVSPSPHTRPAIAAQGFRPFANGQFVAVPLLQGPWRGVSVRTLAAAPAAWFDDAAEAALLRAHEERGCIALVARVAARSVPLVLRRSRMLRDRIVCGDLMYCRDVADVVQVAGPVARHLARHHAMMAIAIDANAPIAGLVGHFVEGRAPKYYKGHTAPRLGALPFTEAVVFGA